MSVELALRTLVLGDTSISGRVGGRMHLDEIPLESERPAIVYRVVSVSPVGTLIGATPLARYWFTVGVRSGRAIESLEISDLIRARLDGFRATVTSDIESSRWLSRISGWDPTLESHAVDDDYAVWATP